MSQNQTLNFVLCHTLISPTPQTKDPVRPTDFHLFCTSPESVPAYQYQTNHVLLGELKNQDKV